MSAAANKQLMQEIFAAAGNPDPAVRDRSLFVASLADDARWVVTGQYSWSRTFTGKQSILNDLHGHVRSLLVERARTIAHRFIADGDHVVVEAKGNNVTREGVRYDNDYCLLFRLENGKIKEVREYCDSHRRRQPRTLRGSTLAVAGGILARVRIWRSRSRVRRQLAAMNERELQDIGTCSSEIACEAGKPFWRA